jgi:large subunit ribosomal protein L22
VDVDNLYVRTAVANEGPRMKRIRPAPMGRAFRYQRRLAHIIVTVAERKTGAELATAAGEVPVTRAAKKSGKTVIKKAPAKKLAAKKSVVKKAAK